MHSFLIYNAELSNDDLFVSEEYPCARCVGDCHTDEDCVGDLKCFHRRSGDDTSISGCLGRGISGMYKQRTDDYFYWNAVQYIFLTIYCFPKQGLDYCYDERFGKGQADFEVSYLKLHLSNVKIND